MASRHFLSSSRILALSTFSRPATVQHATRAFRTTARRLQEAAPAAPVTAPVKKPVGAFRGGIFGFLLGSTLTGVGVYYYVIEEYKFSNELLTEDIYALQAAVQRVEGYVKTLEEKLEAMSKTKKK